MDNYNVQPNIVNQQSQVGQVQQPGYTNQQPQVNYQQVQQAQQVQQPQVQQPQVQQAQVQQAQQAQQAQQVVTDPAYAQYIAAQRQAALQKEAELLEMQNKFMNKVYDDPKRRQLQEQEAISGDTLGKSGVASEKQLDISMEDIMRARFNESTNTVQINFKKTCLIKAYETEVVEGSATIALNEPMSGIERALAINIIEAQVEQAVNENVLAKGLVTHYEYEQKKKALVETVNELRTQAIKLVGEEQVNKIFNM